MSETSYRNDLCLCWIDDWGFAVAINGERSCAKFTYVLSQASRASEKTWNEFANDIGWENYTLLPIPKSETEIPQEP
jgi:hypothetical protein